MRKQRAVFCSDVTDFCPVCGQRQAGISVFAYVCAVMFGYLSASHRVWTPCCAADFETKEGASVARHPIVSREYTSQ